MVRRISRKLRCVPEKYIMINIPLETINDISSSCMNEGNTDYQIIVSVQIVVRCLADIFNSGFGPICASLWFIIHPWVKVGSSVWTGHGHSWLCEHFSINGECIHVFLSHTFNFFKVEHVNTSCIKLLPNVMGSCWKIQGVQKERK